MDEDKEVLQFHIRATRDWAYILWPWDTPEGLIYTAAEWDAFYKLRRPHNSKRQHWLELLADAGTHGEHERNLFFGHTVWGPAVYRKFNIRRNHYLTQHGLDGLPQSLWRAAYEYDPGEPQGRVQIRFRFELDSGAFNFSFYDWVQYFVSGRNEHVKNMGIQVTKKRR